MAELWRNARIGISQMAELETLLLKLWSGDKI